MGYSIGWDSTHGRDIGYGVPAVCEHPGCNEEIDRGMGYACGGGFPEDGCGLYFCGKHLYPCKCERCTEGKEPFGPKPDTKQWIEWKLTDESWKRWREENPEEVAKLTALLANAKSEPTHAALSREVQRPKGARSTGGLCLCWQRQRKDNDMSKEVTVEVTITERVTYSARVQMPLEKFEALDKQWVESRGDERRQVEERIGEFCDRLTDWQDSDDLEIEDFRVVPDDEA